MSFIYVVCCYMVSYMDIVFCYLIDSVILGFFLLNEELYSLFLF